MRKKKGSIHDKLLDISGTEPYFLFTGDKRNTNI